MAVWVEIDLCDGCRRCKRECPYDAIEIKDGKAHIGTGVFVVAHAWRYATIRPSTLMFNQKPYRILANTRVFGYSQNNVGPPQQSVSGVVG